MQMEATGGQTNHPAFLELSEYRGYLEPADPRTFNKIIHHGDGGGGGGSSHSNFHDQSIPVRGKSRSTTTIRSSGARGPIDRLGWRRPRNFAAPAHRLYTPAGPCGAFSGAATLPPSPPASPPSSRPAPHCHGSSLSTNCILPRHRNRRRHRRHRRHRRRPLAAIARAGGKWGRGMRACASVRVCARGGAGGGGHKHNTFQPIGRPCAGNLSPRRRRHGFALPPRRQRSRSHSRERRRMPPSATPGRGAARCPGHFEIQCKRKRGCPAGELNTHRHPSTVTYLPHPPTPTQLNPPNPPNPPNPDNFLGFVFGPSRRRQIADRGSCEPPPNPRLANRRGCSRESPLPSPAAANSDDRCSEKRGTAEGLGGARRFKNWLTHFALPLPLSLAMSICAQPS
jgi:hypothetical protein